MNYLAHIYLSGTDPDIQVGGLLGDFVKGPLRSDYPLKIETGIRLHRRIDRETDSHPAFRQQLTALPKPWRRFGGILLDVYFDHLLASRWQDFHPGPLEEYCSNFYQYLQRHRALLPERAKMFATRAPEVKWLENYANRTSIPHMLNNLGKRLRRPVALGDAWQELEIRRDELALTLDILINCHQTLADNFLQDNL